MSKISIVKGEDRKENITRAIKLIENDINKAIKNKKAKQLFIKINAIDSNFHLAGTHIGALDAVLNIFYDRFDNIIVGDNSFVFTKNKGGPYRGILNKYPKVQLSDLTEFESENIEFMIDNGKTALGKVSLLPKQAFTISLALPKTHDTFVYTGCLKNMFGCVINGRGNLHAQSLVKRLFLNKYIKLNKIKWQNLIRVIKKTKPDLCILDGYEGMEGNGPLFGNKIDLRIAMCSTDGLALDRLASKICGMNCVPYLLMLPSKEKLEIIKWGFNDFKEIEKKFELHYNYKYQITDYPTSFFPAIDIKFVISVLKRAYRIRDKIFEKLGEKYKQLS